MLGCHPGCGYLFRLLDGDLEHLSHLSHTDFLLDKGGVNEPCKASRALQHLRWQWLGLQIFHLSSAANPQQALDIRYQTWVIHLRETYLFDPMTQAPKAHPKDPL